LSLNAVLVFQEILGPKMKEMKPNQKNHNLNNTLKTVAN